MVLLRMNMIWRNCVCHLRQGKGPHRCQSGAHSVAPLGSRILTDPAKVFEHNMWDHMQWSEEEAAAARKKVEENSATRVAPEEQGTLSVPETQSDTGGADCLGSVIVMKLIGFSEVPGTTDLPALVEDIQLCVCPTNQPVPIDQCVVPLLSTTSSCNFIQLVCYPSRRTGPDAALTSP